MCFVFSQQTEVCVVTIRYNTCIVYTDNNNLVCTTSDQIHKVNYKQRVVKLNVL